MKRVGGRSAFAAAHRSVPAAPGGALLVAAALLAGCAGPPRSVVDLRTDGPGARPPADLAATPDAEPRVEPVRAGGPNKPYQVDGRGYTPLAADARLAERGLASWYGRAFHGRPTASGEIYDMYAMTAAHPTLPIPSYARIRNPANGREVIVRVNDRGPFHPGRIVDLSYAAAARLDLLRGVAPVELERLSWDDIRAGRFRREARPLREPAAPEPADSREALAARLLGVDPPAVADAPPPAVDAPPPAGER